MFCFDGKINWFYFQNWCKTACIIFKEIKSLVYLKFAVASSALLVRKERFRKFRPSTLVFIYFGVMLLIYLFTSLAMIVGNIFNDNLDNFYTFAAMMKSSAYVISHSCFLFSTLLFLGEFVNFLNALLSFNSSIYFTLISFDSNFNCVKAQVSVLVPLRTSNDFLIFFSDLKWKIICCFVFVSLWL